MRVFDLFIEDLASDVRKLAAANNIKDPNKIYVGQKITLPDGSIYTVAAGDTLSKIASGAVSNVGQVSTISPGPHTNIKPDTRTKAQALVKPPATTSQVPTAPSTGEAGIQAVVGAGPGYTDVKTTDGQVLRRQGVRNWRNNNPGNIVFGSWAKSKGAVGSDGRFAVFPTLEIGNNAKRDLLFSPTGKYFNLSIANAIAKYAPPNENDTERYISSVVSAVGADADTVLKDLNSIQQDKFLNAINKVEGFRIGKVVAVPTQTVTADIHDDPEDTVELDIPLLLRMLEYAREDAKTDMDLHNVTDKMIELSSQGGTLDMENYQDIVGQDVEERFQSPKHLFTRRDRFKSLKRENVGGSKAEKLVKDISYKPDDEDEVKEGYGRYWCSTDKRWKDRKGPKQSRG